jgi:hypothetical protein
VTLSDAELIVPRCCVLGIPVVALNVVTETVCGAAKASVAGSAATFTGPLLHSSTSLKQ